MGYDHDTVLPSITICIEPWVPVHRAWEPQPLEEVSWAASQWPMLFGLGSLKLGGRGYRWTAPTRRSQSNPLLYLLHHSLFLPDCGVHLIETMFPLVLTFEMGDRGQCST